MAAGYLSLDENNLLRVAHAGGVRPVDLGLELTRWRRNDLDRLVAKLVLKPYERVSHTNSDTSGIEAAPLERIPKR